MLRVEKLSKTYKAGYFKKHSYKAIDEISFAISPGETLGVVGESGCGKSTLARVLLALNPPTSGRVFFKNCELTRLSDRELRAMRGKIQIIFQHPESALNPRKKIYDSLVEPMRIQKLQYNQVEERRIIDDLLEQVGLDEEHLTRYPHELSGGQIQRVVLARILSIMPEFIVADEPTSMLDVSVQAQVLRILKDIQQKHQITYLFISHDLALVEWMSDRIAIMHHGRIVEIGPAEDICSHPQHPYSAQLVKSFSLFQEKGRLNSIQDSSQIEDVQDSCHYAPYCSWVDSKCRQKPELRRIAREHDVACWHV